MAQQRSLIAGFGILLVTASIGFAGRQLTPPFQPEVPSYRSKGPADAPITITEFSDFQCPACQTVVGPLQQIQKLYPGKIRIAFSHMPWDFHRWAANAAVAADCAGKQDKFWELHDILFAKQRAWALATDVETNKADIKKFAESIELNMDDWNACINDPASAKAVADELKRNRDAWVKSTPTLVINGKRFIGSQQLRTLGLNHIENELAKAGAL